MLSEGIIPARAGFTSRPFMVSVTVGDHPRTRGVYTVIPVPRRGCWGSSPHARGLLLDLLVELPRQRIIPACAGFTGQVQDGVHAGLDHPRMRGVYVPLRGLPPEAPGIIPACAGFTPGGHSSCHTRGDHPRMRGVYPAGARWCACARGSSPHARGLHGDDMRPLPEVGIIPACAGFTWPRRRARPWCGDHPRMRGVYNVEQDWIAFSRGSSPHARGLQPVDHVQESDLGIIPARAGFTTGTSSSLMVTTDHPRTRGAYGRPAGR